MCLHCGNFFDVRNLDVSAPFNIESYKTAEGQYAIPFKAKYLKLTDNSVQSGDVLSSKIGANSGQQVKIKIMPNKLPTNKESIFYLNVLDIPPNSPEQEGKFTF